MKNLPIFMLAVAFCLITQAANAQTPKQEPGTNEGRETAKKDQGTSPPKNFTNSIGMKFVWIPPGSFMMGSPNDEKQRRPNETQHKVTLTKGFYMGVYTVTQEEWQMVMDNNPSGFKGEKNLPVERVSWKDCQEFIKRLRAKDKKLYRLPTEAEWEYACRAGTKTPFHFGQTISTDQANYNGNWTYGDGEKGTFRQKTTPVGSFPANAWGLHDMHGNLWQLCQDWHGAYPNNDVVDPQGPSSSGEGHVMRGGAWNINPGDSRSACRAWCFAGFGDVPAHRFHNIGCRLCFFVDDDEKKKDEDKPEVKPKDPPKTLTNSIGMKFVWIPPGSFMMGSPKEEMGRRPDENQHKVKLTTGFYMGVYAVTQEEWQSVMGRNPSHFKGDKNLPAESVSWADCQDFIKKLREKDKKPYRLPTEAEWEYACRAGTTTPFHFGETISTDQANYWGDTVYGNGKKGIDRKKTTPVGSFPANAWGLHDMHGNVWQWCQDWYTTYPQQEMVDPQGSDAGEHRVLRGGSWDINPRFCRSACRISHEPSIRLNRYGLRVCFSVE